MIIFIILFSFNLPSVRANLDRLIGKDIVQLNDHKFMMELRKKVWEDFDEKLIEKIQQREVIAKVHCIVLSTIVVPCLASVYTFINKPNKYVTHENTSTHRSFLLCLYIILRQLLHL